jgi:uncharacterized protein
MWRIIFLAVIVWLVIALVKRVIKQSTSDMDIAKPKRDSNDIVKCEQCEMHILESEAFSVNGKYYCSKAHLPDNPS